MFGSVMDSDHFTGGLVMITRRNLLGLLAALLLTVWSGTALPAYGQERSNRTVSRDDTQQGDEPGTANNRNQPAPDPAADAIAVKNVPNKRPEQQITNHDQSPVFDITKPAPLTMDLKNQPKAGRITGFDFARDPLNSDKPFTMFEEVMKKESAAKPQVMAAQRKLLESRYNLEPKFDPENHMSRGKPIPVGPTARLQSGVSFDQLAQMSPQEVKRRNLFPYPSLPHPLQTNGGQVVPQVQIKMFPRLQRFDVDFDIPDAFLPEFPPAIFLQQRPELGDVSRGQVVSMAN